MVIASAAVLMPLYIGVGWILYRRSAEHDGRGRLVWVVASIVGIVVTAVFAAYRFAEPLIDRDPLGGPPSFAFLDGLILGASAVLSILVFVVLLFFSGRSPAPEATDRPHEEGPATDPLRGLSDDW
jgi:hypothetical protein